MPEAIITGVVVGLIGVVAVYATAKIVRKDTLKDAEFTAKRHASHVAAKARREGYGEGLVDGKEAGLRIAANARKPGQVTIKPSSRGLYRANLEVDGKAIFVSATGRTTPEDAAADVAVINGRTWVVKEADNA